MTLSLYAIFSLRLRLVSDPLDALEVDTVLVHLVQGGHVPEVPDLVDDEVRNVVDLLFGRVAAETEADARVRELVADAERTEHVARFEAGGRARRAGAHRHLFDRHHHRLALDEGERHVEIAWQAMLERAVYEDLFEGGL